VLVGAKRNNASISQAVNRWKRIWSLQKSTRLPWIAQRTPNRECRASNAVTYALRGHDHCHLWQTRQSHNHLYNWHIRIRQDPSARCPHGFQWCDCLKLGETPGSFPNGPGFRY
jgi:hypothetical protein